MPSSIIIIYFTALFLHALYLEKNLSVASKAVLASYIQLTAYGVGFISEFLKNNPKTS
jgi:hypothetical protein